MIATVLIGAGAAAAGEALGQYITTGSIDGDFVGYAAIMGGWSAFAGAGLMKMGVPLWPANIIPAAMATLMYGRAANASEGAPCP